MVYWYAPEFTYETLHKIKGYKLMKKLLKLPIFLAALAYNTERKDSL